MSEPKSGIIRKKKVSFAQVSNFALRDENLSLKAKGLLSLIESYLSLEDFTLYKNFLMKKSSDGKTAFESAWQELKRNGYLIQYKFKDPSTKQFYYEYEVDDNPHTENEDVAQKPHTDFPGLANLGSGKATSGKPPLYNNTLDNNNLPINILFNIHTNIDYFYAFANSVDKQSVDNIVNVMLEIYCIDSKTVKINKNDIPIEVVRDMLDKVQMNHIQYTLDVIHSMNGKINNMKSFILSTLYNSVMTLSLYYDNLVNVNK